MTLPFATDTSLLAKPVEIHTLQDVWDWIASHAKDPSNLKKGNPHGFRLQYLTTLKNHCGDAPLSTLPADLEVFDRDFPKSKKGVHPRPDLNQPLEAYKKWRQNARKAIEIATGAAAQKTALRACQDGWVELLDAIGTHSKEGGCIHHGAASSVTKLSDVARRARIEPWDLAEATALDRLEAAFAAPGDRGTLRRAQRLLNDFGMLPELANVLPREPVSVFPTLRQRAALPPHIEAYLGQLVDRAAVERDEVSGKDSQSASDDTKKGWLSALRHHIRSLPRCPIEPDLGYDTPITDLAAVNHLEDLFNRDHLAATIRHTAAHEHLPDHISHVSGYDYYGAILVVLSRNELLDDATYEAITKSKFMKDGRELAKGMTAANKAWCKALVQDPMKEKRFRNMHRILMAKADEILDAAVREGRELTQTELIKARQLGTCAAACAIEYAGRPIRMGNCLGLRLRGTTANFITPGKGQQHYAFSLAANETKSGKEEPETKLLQEMHGPQVLSWYLRRIRPLFSHHKESIYLFPAVETQNKPLSKGTFDKWFQRAASAAGLAMTFHLWRHGYASLLLATDWGNLPHAAQLLGNTPAVCARNYAWIDKEKLITEGQNKMLESAEARR